MAGPGCCKEAYEKHLGGVGVGKRQVPVGKGQGCLVSCAPLLPHCLLCSLPVPRELALPLSLALTCTQGKARYRHVRTYLPWAHWDRQRVCLSHLCCWNGVWRRKEKPFVLQCALVHACCLFMGLGTGFESTAHSACSMAAALLLGTSHTNHSKTLMLAAGWSGGHSKVFKKQPKHGAPLTLPQCPFPLPAMIWSLHAL